MNNYFQGVRALEEQDYPRAIGCFSRALNLDPDDADSHAERGFAYLAGGELAQAQADCAEALRIDPGHARGCQLREAIGAVPAPIRANGHAVTAEDSLGLRAREREDAPSAKIVESATAPLTLRSLWGVGRAAIASALVHAAVLTGLAMIVVHVKSRTEPLMVLASSMPASPAAPEAFVFAAGGPEEVVGPMVPRGATLVSARSSIVPKLESMPRIEPRATGALRLALLDQALGDEATTDILREYDTGLERPSTFQTELAELRSEHGRRAAVLTRGGTPQSEAAVERALVWLARHQNYDGGWNFDHRFCGDCRGACSSPGVLSGARVGATAIALLPFLGAGHTHLVDKHGTGSKYAKQVLAGLRFLVRSMRNDGGMNEPTGRMYDQGLASIVLCEAYAMTQDRTLLKPAERALGFIVAAQDPIGGGWRYQPQMPGDTSVVGWQLMAIKSGQMAYLRVPQATIDGVGRFLDAVSMEEGTRYGYVDGNYGTDATAAVGLLCRMYLGWKREQPELARGVQMLSTLEPSATNVYFNYYATQVLHHYEGPLWDKWNTSMREYLVRSQAERGHEKGSWFFDDPHTGPSGGRLCATSLAAMTLEVYYRHMPLYSKRAVRDKLGQ